MPPHSVLPVGQTQARATQSWSRRQRLKQAPQWLRLVAMATQTPAQHAWPAAQTRPQTPQLVRSVWRLTQRSAQSTVPVGQAAAPRPAERAPRRPPRALPARARKRPRRERVAARRRARLSKRRPSIDPSGDDRAALPRGEARSFCGPSGVSFKHRSRPSPLRARNVDRPAAASPPLEGAPSPIALVVQHRMRQQGLANALRSGRRFGRAHITYATRQSAPSASNNAGAGSTGSVPARGTDGSRRYGRHASYHEQRRYALATGAPVAICHARCYTRQVDLYTHERTGAIDCFRPGRAYGATDRAAKATRNRTASVGRCSPRQRPGRSSGRPPSPRRGDVGRGA